MVDFETTLVEFRCELGTSILHPDNWEPRSVSNGFTISHPNGQAVVSSLSYLKEGSGTAVEFGQRLAKELTSVEQTEWLAFQIGGYRAIKWHSDVDEPNAKHWLLYVVECGGCLHAIIVELIEIIAVLNWRFYEQLAQTFRGIETLPNKG